MTIDLNKYIINKRYIQKWYLDHKDADIQRSISILSSATMCPAIAVAYWIGEASNWDIKSIDTIKKLIAFYDYSEIIGKPENAPI